MNKVLEKLKKLPKTPGVYIFRDNDRKIIYVGKAVNLKNRIGSYFTGVIKEVKTRNLVSSISNLEWIETGSEIGALLLESELIKRYKPKFNIELKDNKNFLYIKIPKEDFPLPIFVRNPSDDKAKYLGPFTDSGALRRVLKLIRKVFPWRSKGDLKSKRPCLYYHLNLCPGVCIGKISKSEYGKNIRGLIRFFEGKSEALKRNFEREMKKTVKEKDFEKAAVFRDKINDLKKIESLHILKEEDFAKRDSALFGLKRRLELKDLPRRIECFDISNISGKEAVGSMAVFEDGIPKKEDYRKFKIKIGKGIDDAAMMGEVLRRRFKRLHLEGVSRKGVKVNGWDKLPDLVIIDGGKGQLGVALEILKNYNLQIPAISLAKKNEEIYQRVWDNKFRSYKFKKIILSEDSEVLYLLQRIRDEAHRFAITYFRSLHAKTANKSALDGIHGIGPKTKKKLINHFGSVSKIKEMPLVDLEKIISKKIALKIKEYL